ncbi:glycoside hydrolase family 45 protein [Zopfia rhizophila CBS 207.26]|uniref:cellulase n=1 Tax=Zopfia rhizophila CBS 207.26 TaxID=1314779 RepID=A0A6A6EFE2_9PEZI|nr:glycoside hydrolase family 45 protein [Zopfia rhizophila CBS 207.26]
MTLSYLRNTLLLLDLFVVLTHGADLAISGDAVTTRFWDCCKPSCSWNGKAHFSQPVLTCDKEENPLKDFSAGTGCNGGSAYSCTNQQPWAVNDTFSYGFAGIFIQGHVEDFWCCACYQLDFTSDPLKNKTMIIQASNTAYDVATANRFSLAVPGGNTTSHDACANQFGVSQTVFGEENSGVESKDDCDNLPESMRPGCLWRFDWFQNALYPSATFKRVVCPAELTEKTGCTRDDDKALANNSQSSATTNLSSVFTVFAAVAVIITSLLLV